jgi:hypothetical protein
MYVAVGTEEGRLLMNLFWQLNATNALVRAIAAADIGHPFWLGGFR